LYFKALIKIPKFRLFLKNSNGLSISGF